MSRSNRVPSVWRGLAWALRPGTRGTGLSRSRLAWRAVQATLTQGKALRRWMGVAFELHERGLVPDLQAEYVRAMRPHVHRGTRVNDRVVQLIDHADWLETAFKRPALERLASGQPLVLLELPAPRGWAYMRLQLQRAAPHSPEGDLLLTLTLQRASEVQHKPPPLEVAAVGFSRFRVDGLPCLAIGGVRGQRHPVQRLSPVEIGQALQGWKPPVLMVRVMQELARHWGLHLIGLNPNWHQLQGWPYRWRKRYREAAQGVYSSYDALWNHFDAKPGPTGWMVLPVNSDEKLAATALSPEKRGRQTQRADYWIRTRNQLRSQLRDLLLRPSAEARLDGATQGETVSGDAPDSGFQHSEDMVPSRVLETGPGSLE